MGKIWIKKSDSFEESEKFNKDYYFSMSPSERLDIMQFLKKQIRKIKPFYAKKDKKDGSRERLRRVIKIIQ